MFTSDEPDGSDGDTDRDEHAARFKSSGEPVTPVIDSGRPSGGRGNDKPFEVSASRRRPVVFEEDDDLDVPDFLK